jgi:hypothetical protein
MEQTFAELAQLFSDVLLINPPFCFALAERYEWLDGPAGSTAG